MSADNPLSPADLPLRIERADVVVVGGGGAGLSAALAAAESFVTRGQADAVIALISKVYPMRSHTVAAEGGAAGVMPGGGDSLEQHVADTLRGGAGLSHEDAVRFIVEQAPIELARLERLGMPWTRDESGQPAVRPFGGMTHPRTWFAADKTGFHLLHTLYQTTLRTKSIHHFNEHLVLDLLLDDTTRPSLHREQTGFGRRSHGVVGYDQQRGEVVVWLAPAVILATGGYARAWGTSTNAGIVTGDGLTMALRAGLPLRDLEMVQVHPTCLPGSGILITEAARGEGGVLLDANGERYLADYGLGPPTPRGEPMARRMELGPRDALSQAFFHAERDGRTTSTVEGSVVYLDLRHLGAERIKERLPLVSELARRFAGVDPTQEPIPVRPAAHYTMGGIVTTPMGQVLTAEGTKVAGLFAVGECASTGLHGANRLGSNSLVETLVVGRAAGATAASLAEVNDDSAVSTRFGSSNCRIDVKLPNRPQDAEQRLIAHARELAAGWLAMRGRGIESPAEIRRELGRVLDAEVSIFRDAAGLARAATALDGLAARYENVRVADTSDVLNTDWVQVLELGAMLTLARGTIAAAQAREESRGAHQRLDFPDLDPAAHHSITAMNTDNSLRVHLSLAERGKDEGSPGDDAHSCPARQNDREEGR
ncbi:MAG: FAD-binding protein [Promicromonosporaceae bacterium]|nr:FAD-binding protein [Promicromonosporaceae bacterium]